MKRLLPFLVVLGVAGCAVTSEEPEAEGPAGASASALTTPTFTLPPGAITPQPLLPGPTPKLPPIVFTPVVPAKCTTQLNRFAVLTRACTLVSGKGGYWSARPIFTSEKGTLCDMRWHPNMFVDVAPPALDVLERIAEREEAAFVFPKPAAIRPLCDSTPVCNPELTSCTDREPVALPDVPMPHDGMGGCTSCAFVAGDTLYAVLPSEYTARMVDIFVGTDVIHVEPAGAQTFMVNVSNVPSRTSGFASVYRR